MRVVVGRIGRPHGIRGEVTVEVRTDEPEQRFAPGAVLLVDTPVSALTVIRSHWHSGRLLVSFEGVEDRNDAEALRGTMLHIDRDDNESPGDPEEFYDSTLMGCAVFDIAGVLLGEVTEIVHLPAQDMLSVRTTTDHDVLIPLVQEIVPTIDVAARRIVIDPPPGLIDVQVE